MSAPTPAAEQCGCDADEACNVCEPCGVCRDGAEACDCDGETDWDGGYVCCSGWRIPDHCCDCGGSPYCVKCHTCGAECFGDCRCPITVSLSSGGTITL
ncbi:hypothetical protein [Sphaerisporangium sp. NPDC051011]|uniref:hypothetical protein n=1 Tax=Sphaerisporangium sp. NPDC051011 TaxID=3155792 RepID=UPI0033C6513F